MISVPVQLYNTNCGYVLGIPVKFYGYTSKLLSLLRVFSFLSLLRVFSFFSDPNVYASIVFGKGLLP